MIALLVGIGILALFVVPMICLGTQRQTGKSERARFSRFPPRLHEEFRRMIEQAELTALEDTERAKPPIRFPPE